MMKKLLIVLALFSCHKKVDTIGPETNESGHPIHVTMFFSDGTVKKEITEDDIGCEWELDSFGRWIVPRLYSGGSPNIIEKEKPNTRYIYIWHSDTVSRINYGESAWSWCLFAPEEDTVIVDDFQVKYRSKKI